MPQPDRLLIGFSLICLLLALVWGFYWHQSRVWKWIDVIYYPVAILGICLLFISRQSDRELIDIRTQQIQLEQQRQNHLASKPTPPRDVPALDDFKQRYEMIQTEAQLGQACQLSGEVSCVPPVAHERLIRRDFAGFPPATSAGDPLSAAAYIDGFCRRALTLIDSLTSSNEVGADIFRELKTSLAAQPAEPDFRSSLSSQNAFEADLRGRLDGVLPALSEDVRSTYRAIWEVNSRFAMTLHWAASACLRIPAGQTEWLQTMQRWNAKTPTIESARADLEDRVKKIKDKPLGGVDLLYSFVIVSLWPFVIVLALALKFAKGVAGVAK